MNGFFSNNRGLMAVAEAARLWTVRGNRPNSGEFGYENRSRHCRLALRSSDRTESMTRRHKRSRPASPEQTGALSPLDGHDLHPPRRNLALLVTSSILLVIWIVTLLVFAAGAHRPRRAGSGHAAHVRRPVPNVSRERSGAAITPCARLTLPAGEPWAERQQNVQLPRRL